ncbi:hypothetical protein HMPREF0731_3895, partial [Pseudoroseomonas cervicalis ATCC 49957]
STPARVGTGQGMRASAPQRSGIVAKGRPSRSAMPSGWAAVPARGSASTQMAASPASVMDAPRPGRYQPPPKETPPCLRPMPPTGTATRP